MLRKKLMKLMFGFLTAGLLVNSISVNAINMIDVKRMGNIVFQGIQNHSGKLTLAAGTASIGFFIGSFPTDPRGYGDELKRRNRNFYLSVACGALAGMFFFSENIIQKFQKLLAHNIKA